LGKSKISLIKKPIFVGSNYIYIEFQLNDYKSGLPLYITENFSSQQILNSSYNLPKYTMIKFKSKESNIDEVYSILKIALGAREWNVIVFLSKTSRIKKKSPIIEEPKYVPNQVSGLGIERTKNIIISQIDDQNKAIKGSFTDIQSLKANAEQMV
jgi:hypothetical protein